MAPLAEWYPELLERAPQALPIWDAHSGPRDNPFLKVYPRGCWCVAPQAWSNGMSHSRSKCGPFFRLVWWSPNGHLQHIPGIESARHGSSCSDYEW